MAQDKAKQSTAKKTQSRTAKKRTIADIKAKKKAVTKKVYIQMDGEVANKIEELRGLFIAARDSDRLSNTPDQAPKIQAKIDRLVKKSESTIEMFVFKSIGRFRYDELVSAHPPTKERKKAGDDFNADTFPPVLVSESCIDPEFPLEDAIEIFSDPDWNGAELRKLFFGALDVNTETGEIPLSKSGSDATLSSLLKLATQSDQGSLTASM